MPSARSKRLSAAYLYKSIVYIGIKHGVERIKNNREQKNSKIDEVQNEKKSVKKISTLLGMACDGEKWKMLIQI